MKEERERTEKRQRQRRANADRVYNKTHSHLGVKQLRETYEKLTDLLKLDTIIVGVM